MKIMSLELGSYGTNCYIVYDENTKNAAVIDPGAEADYIMKYVEKEGLSVKLILLTHGHFDHTGAVDELRSLTGAEVRVHEKDYKDRLGNIDMSAYANYFGEGDDIKLDSLSFKVLNTPGHTPGSCVFLIDGVMLSGDTLFAGSCGRTDFPGGSWEQMMESLKRLSQLDGDYSVLPGHMGATTLSRERITNPYMKEAMGG